VLLAVGLARVAENMISLSSTVLLCGSRYYWQACTHRSMPAGIAFSQWSKNRFCALLGATHYSDKRKNLARGSGPQSLVPNLVAAKLSDIMLRRV